MPETKFMSLAIEEAYNGIKNGEGGPFGAVVVKLGKVIASAHNTVLKDNDPTRHAEVNAISAAARKMASYDLSRCVIYCTTEPCPMCFSAIHWARLGAVIYGTAIEDVKELGFNELAIKAAEMRKIGGSPVEVIEGFMKAECAALLKNWSDLPNRKVY